MAITIGAVDATCNGAYFKKYLVTAGLAGDTTADVTHGGVVDFNGVAVQPNFLYISPSEAAAADRQWSIIPTIGSETTKVTVTRVNAGALNATIWIGYLHTVAKGSAT